jgi:hypothetical protein
VTVDDQPINAPPLNAPIHVTDVTRGAVAFHTSPDPVVLVRSIQE